MDLTEERMSLYEGKELAERQAYLNQGASEALAVAMQETFCLVDYAPWAYVDPDLELADAERMKVEGNRNTVYCFESAGRDMVVAGKTAKARRCFQEVSDMLEAEEEAPGLDNALGSLEDLGLISEFRFVLQNFSEAMRIVEAAKPEIDEIRKGYGASCSLEECIIPGYI
jgi:hypothetical protein